MITYENRIYLKLHLILKYANNLDSEPKEDHKTFSLGLKTHE